jgi:hypothetical protein
MLTQKKGGRQSLSISISQKREHFDPFTPIFSGRKSLKSMRYKSSNQPMNTLRFFALALLASSSLLAQIPAATATTTKSNTFVHALACFPERAQNTLKREQRAASTAPKRGLNAAVPRLSSPAASADLRVSGGKSGLSGAEQRRCA